MSKSKKPRVAHIPSSLFYDKEWQTLDEDGHYELVHVREVLPGQGVEEEASESRWADSYFQKWQESEKEIARLTKTYEEVDPAFLELESQLDSANARLKDAHQKMGEANIAIARHDWPKAFGILNDYLCAQNNLNLVIEDERNE